MQLQVCTSLQQITTPAPHHSVLQAGCPSCRPTNSVKALKAFKALMATFTGMEMYYFTYSYLTENVNYGGKT